MSAKPRPHGRPPVAVFSALLLAAAALSSSATFAQALNDIPMAVKNNVAPNFMFMLDNSGSMNNIVPTAPYVAATDYSPAGCTGANVLGNANPVDLRVTLGVPAIRWNSTSYIHWTAAAAGATRRCFARTTIYNARLLADSGGDPSSYLGAEYDGNYLNWYFGTAGNAATFPLTGWTDRKRVVSGGTVQSRMEIARTSATGVINGLPASTSPSTLRVGLSTYNSGNGGALRVALNDFTTTHRTTLVNSIASLTPGGATPLAETLADIGRYMGTGYSGNITAGGVSGVTLDNFLAQDGRNSCLSGAACASGTTDAIPSSPSVGTTSRPIQYWCQRSYAFLLTDGRPQSDQAFTNNTHLRDYDGDCSGALAGNCTGSFDRKTARTYESQGSDYLDDVAKALFDVDLRPNLPAPAGRTKKNNLLTYTIGFADLQVQNDPLLINTASQGGGLFLSAQDGSTLTAAFNRVVTDAFSKDAAAAAVAVANAQITLNNIGYASSYKSGAWYGDLVAYSLNTSTALQTGSDIWSLRDNLRSQTPSSRKIATWNGSAGVAFAAGLSYTGKPASLTDGIINYVRGDRTGEGSTYRQRQDVLGDIINAEPVVVNYGAVPIIYQGGNGGMLHVVDGRTDAGVSTRGQELWAYVPRLVHGNLADLASSSYAHMYFIDGTPATAEVSGFGFSRILVGGLGKGGRGYYALDISSYTAANEGAVASKVLWEFSPTNMGYSFGAPLIVKTAAGWRVVVASGYDNGTAAGGDGVGRVWVIDPANPATAVAISTGVGAADAPSGLAHLGRQSNVAADALVRYVWGGDNKGNVWRFDLDTSTVVKLATLTSAGGTLAQPVTSAPEVALISGSTTRFIVQLGTGRYLADADVPGATGVNAEATQRQSIYGIVDDTTQTSVLMPNIRGTNGTVCPSGGGDGDFVCQTLSFVSATNTYQVTTHSVDPAARRGWYVDLPQDSNLTNGRVISKPSLTTGGTLTLTVNIPTNVQCDPGGRSWFLAINGSTGGAVVRNAGGNTYYDAGYFLGYALASRPVIVTTADGKRALIRMSDKTVVAPPVPEPATTAAPWRRIYWRPVN